VFGLPAVLLLVPACRDQDAPPETIKSVSVGPVVLYDMTLGPDATPQQVTYAMMRAIRDSIDAGQKRDRAARDQALNNQLALAAVTHIYRNNRRQADPAQASQEDIDTTVYKVVRFWAPIVSRYVGSFSGGPDDVMKAMRVQPHGSEELSVLYDVVDPVDQSKVTLNVYLVREQGTTAPHTSQKFWRVRALAYTPYGAAAKVGTATRSAATLPTSQPGR
jgi:hypothetical protein